MDICEFKTSLLYRVNSRTAKTTQRNPVGKKEKEGEREGEEEKRKCRKTLGS